MSSSASADLFYGLTFPDSCGRKPWQPDESEDPDSEDADDRYRAEHARLLGRIADKPTCEVIYHGAIEYGDADYAVAIRSTRVTADWDGASSITLPVLPDNANEILKAYCDLMGIPFDAESAGWHLVASYG